MNKELMVRKEGTIRELLEKPETRKRIKQAIPAHIDEAQFLRIVLSVILSDEKLMDCTPRSLLTSVMAIAQLGLSPIPALGQAYIVPFGREAKFIPGYRGYLVLARRSGEIKKVDAQLVCENDDFILEYGTDEKLQHKPAEGERGKPKGCYVIFRFNDGTPDFDYMTTEDINKIRDQFSKQPNGLMWKDSWPEGGKKTVLKRKIKLIPLAVEEMHKASALEDQAYRGEDQFDMVFPESVEPPKQIDDKSFMKAVDDYYQEAHPGQPPPEGGKLGEFVAATALANEMGPGEIMQAATLNMEDFLKQYDTWIMQEAGKDEETKLMPFKGLKKPGLIKWEEENRHKMTAAAGMSGEIQRAFFAKWEKVMGQPYADFLHDLQGHPPEEGEPEGESPGLQLKDDSGTSSQASKGEYIDCPNTGEQIKRSYCENSCRSKEGCPAFE